ncbi:MAG: tryptophan synthase subunit alpha [Bacteroidales bacterium]|jgi:tryptophan synthase alpha chain|nr:tryptophan synthase subunit alpha [Bacteroidales bacterium]
MNRISNLLKNKRKNILSVFFTAGTPKLNDTAEVIRELQEHCIDMIEIGIPFSDPLADGPAIQQSSKMALSNGMNLKLLFSQLEGIRTEKKINIPLILMGYLNPIIQFGLEEFCRRCSECGIDGLIIPDLPYDDYIASYKKTGDKYGIKFIMLITPETSEKRVIKIDRSTDGFIYMVSTASTTGAKKSFDEKTLEYFNRINSMGLKNPRIIGFGISNKKTLDNAWNNSSGAIIGSKFVNLLAEKPTIKEAVGQLIRDLDS